MSAALRAVDVGDRHGRALLAGIGQEIRDGRLSRDLSQENVVRAVGISQSQLSLIERGLAPTVSLLTLARLLAVVGLELGAKAYPGGQPLRDSAHLALLERLRSRVSSRLTWRTEVVLPIPGDRRAWDACIFLRPGTIGVEAETRPRDLQELQRRLSLKKRDGGVERVILLLANTRWNRALVRDNRERLTVEFPIAADRALAALAAGRDPGGDACILL